MGLLCTWSSKLLILLWFANFSLEFATCSSSSSPSPIIATFPSNQFRNRFPHYSPAFRCMVQDKNTGFLYIGADNWIFKLDWDLNVMASVKTAPDSTYPTKCRTFDECEIRYVSYEHQVYAHRNRMLVINYDFDELISCGYAESQTLGHQMYHNLTCAGWSLKDLSAIPERKSFPSLSDNSIYVFPLVSFIAPGPSNTSNPSNVLYWTPTRFFDSTTLRISSHSLDPKDNLEMVFPREGLPTPSSGPRSEFHLIYGFSSQGFSYFVTWDDGRFPEPSWKYKSRLIRVCQKDPTYSSYADIPIRCVDGSGEDYGLAFNAHLGRPGSELARELNIDVDQDVLFVLFSRGAMCTYSMKQIRNTFRDNRQTFSENVTVGVDEDFCGPDDTLSAEPLIGDIPVLSEPTIVFKNRDTRGESIVTTSSGSSTLVFVLTSDGQLQKYLLVGAHAAVPYFSSEYARNGVRTNILMMDLSEEHIYTMQHRQVTKVPVHTCSKFRTLEGCINAADPLCGWCVKYSRCTTEESCSRSPLAEQEEGEPWITCTTRTARSLRITPTKDPVYVDLLSSDHVDVATEYPSICYKRVKCRYSNESWTPGRVLERNEVRCSMPPVPFGSGITGTQELHLRIDKRGLFPILSIEKNVTFYNCSRYKSFEDCAPPPFPCTWNAETTQCHSNQQNSTTVSAKTFVNLTWVVDYSQKAEVADGKLVIQYQAGEPILLNCEVPERVPPSNVVYRVEYGTGPLAPIQTFPLHGSRQVLAFLDDNTFGARLECRAQFDGETFGSLSARIDIVRNEVSSTRSSFVYKNVDSLPSSFGIWCQESCSYSVGEGVLDAAFRRFDFYTIRMNPPEIHFYRNGNTTLAPVVVELPVTRSMKHVKRTVMSVDPSGPQVMWTHAPGGHLWLTNVETGASVVLKKDFGAVEMSVDWSNDVVFGVSEKDSKCIFKVDLKNTSLITEIFVSEEITSLVVSRYYLFYLTGSGKIIQRDRENGIEWQVFRGYRSPNGRLRSLVADSTRTPYYFHWIQDFFGTTSIVYTMRFYSTFERPEQAEVSRYVAKELIGIGYQDSIFESPCSCSHVLQRHNSGSCVCGCPRGLEIRNETQCSGKWIHLVATGSQKPILMTCDLSKPTQTRQEKSSNSSGIKLLPQSDFGDNPCFAYENGTVNSANLVCWKNPSLTPSKAHFKIPVSADSILEVLTNPGSPELDVVFFEGVCIRILHSETNKTWTLFCGTMSRERGNILVDTESWISFWENGQDKSVYMTELDSLVTRRIIDARNFELEREVSRRLALDSNSKVLYWTHGPKVWRRSYKDVLDSEPELLWYSFDGTPKQLQFHNGFLYWIESIHGLDDSVVSFDIELKSKETLVTSPGKRFESFAVQSDTTSKSSSMKCNECSHFCKKSSLDETSGVCWCPSEKPILASNGTCHEPVLHVVLEPEASIESAVSSISRNEHEGCWSQPQGLVSNENQTETFLGSAFSTCGTKEVLPLGVTEGFEVFSTGSETGAECGCITLTNAETGQRVGTEFINGDRASPFAFDNRRQLAVWCTDRQLRFPKVDGSTADDSSEVHFADPCSRHDDKRCTSLALDEENGRAYFIFGNEIKRLDYASNSSKPLVTTLHQMIYRFANSLSFDGKGHLFWAGGFADFGEFVDMIKVPENPGEMVVSVRVLNDWKNKIVQVQAVRESENPCETSCFSASPVDKFALIRSSAGVVHFVDAEDVFAGGSKFLLDVTGKKLYTMMSREQDGTTSSTSSEPPETSELTTQTVHLDTDLEKSNWTTSNNLKYAATTSELLGPLKFTLRPGKPFFYLSFGGNATAQVRPWQ